MRPTGLHERERVVLDSADLVAALSDDFGKDGLARELGLVRERGAGGVKCEPRVTAFAGSKLGLTVRTRRNR